MFGTNIFYVLRFFGQYPIQKSSNIFHQSKQFLAFNLLLLLTVFFCSTQIVPIHGMRAANFVLETSHQLNSYIFILLIISVVLSPIINRREICEMFQTVAEVDAILNRIGVFPKSNTPALWTLIIFILCLSQFGASTILEVVFPVWSKGIGNTSFLCYQCMDILVFGFFLNFVYVASNLYLRYGLLNDQLKNMMSLKNDKNEVGAYCNKLHIIC